MSKRFAVMGTPIRHSQSPHLHQRFARQFGIRLRYEAINVEAGQLKEALATFQHQGGMGVNITAPLKSEAYAIAEIKKENAHNMQTANVLTWHQQVWEASNTDQIGFERDLFDRLKFNLRQARVLILGAGAVVNAVMKTFEKRGLAEVSIANRNLLKARELAKQHPFLEVLTYQQLINRHFDLIIQATSAGHHHQQLPIPNSFKPKPKLVYDLNYGQSARNFLTWAHGLNSEQVVDGSGMLIEQAAESFRLWHGLMPNTSVIHRDFRSY